MSLTATEKVDVLNIGLMLVSVCVAMVIPFETFLFVYAILGPLHYLTEISWLHDKKYFTKGKYDSVVLLAAAALLTLFNLKDQLGINLPANLDAQVFFIALLSSLIFIFVKNNFYKWAGIVLLIISSQVASKFILFFTLFLPTLIHVYVFTMLFMLYGAFKSKSRMGLLSVFILLLCPFILFYVYPDRAFYSVTEYGQKAYETFKYLNIYSLTEGFDQALPNTMDGWNGIVYHSKLGILVMRFIAFAYTYHYLNWFSKTKVIQWHKVPKWRFALVIVIWIASIALYQYNYVVGIQWLYFMSFLHVVLEFPLNMTSISGIIGHLKNQVIKPDTAIIKTK